MQVLLIHPPVNDPRSPRLALPSLAAFLRQAGITTSLADLDLESLLAILRPENIERARHTLRWRLSNPEARDVDRLRHLYALSESLVTFVNPALQVLRDADRFHEPHELSAARDVLFACVELAAAAARRPVSYRLDLLQYDVQGIDPTRFSDLIAVSADREANLFADYWESEFFPAIQSTAWDVTGISIPTRMQIIPGLTLARELRLRGHYVVIGGNLFTKFIDRLLNLPEFFDYFADGVVVYEGETALLELLNQLQGNRDFAKVPNLLFRHGNEVRLSRLHIENIATLPVPDFSGLPLDRYLSPVPVLPVRFGRGCYWNKCKFCDSSMVNRISPKAYHFRPPEIFVDDVVQLHQQFGCRDFLFADEAIPPKLFAQIAEGFLTRNIRGLRFAAYARLEPGFTEELCHKLAEMGVRRLFFGLESGCQATLDHMVKGIKIEDVRSILLNCSAAGIRYHIFSMIGFPEESEESARQTAAFFERNRDLLDCPGNSFDIHLLELLRRTAYFEEAPQMGLRIRADQVGGEFVVGIGTQWENTRGLSRRRIDELGAQFGARLRSLYPSFDQWPSLLWPTLEEWALLYAAYYENRRFPFRLSLSEGSGDQDYRMRWNPFALIEHSDTGVQITTQRGRIVVTEQMYELIRDSGSMPLHELASLLAQSSNPPDLEQMKALRSDIEVLARSNLLQLRVS